MARAATPSRGAIGTRYVLLAVRTLVDPADPQDLAAVHALQDAIEVEQPGGPGSSRCPSWDQASQKKVREALLVLGATLPDTKRMFGPKDQVDPVRHLIGSAIGLGRQSREGRALSQRHARARTTARPSTGSTSRTCRSTASGRSASTTRKGYFEPNEQNAYTLNNLTAKKGQDGSVAIQFGGCDGKSANCLPIMPGWNYMVRLYRPRPEVLAGAWRFPQAQAVQ